MKYMVYTIRDSVNNIPLYVGRGKTNYGDRPGKHWSRIDVHKAGIRNVQEGVNLSKQVSLHFKLAEVIQKGGQLEFAVVLETDDETHAAHIEDVFTKAYLVENPKLLNVRSTFGENVTPNRVKRIYTDEQRQQMSDKMTGKKRGPYTVSPEGLKGLQQSANDNRRTLSGLNEQDRKERASERHSILRLIRLARKNGDLIKVNELVTKLKEVDEIYGVKSTEFKPKTYATRSRAHMSLDDEKVFLARFDGKAKVREVQEAFKSEYGKDLSVSGAYGMMTRHGVLTSRH